MEAEEAKKVAQRCDRGNIVCCATQFMHAELQASFISNKQCSHSVANVASKITESAAALAGGKQVTKQHLATFSILLDRLRPHRVDLLADVGSVEGRASGQLLRAGEPLQIYLTPRMGRGARSTKR